MPISKRSYCIKTWVTPEVAKHLESLIDNHDNNLSTVASRILENDMKDKQVIYGWKIKKGQVCKQN